VAVKKMNTPYTLYRLVPLNEQSEPANEKSLEASISTALSSTTTTAPTTILAAINSLPTRYRPRAKLLMKKLQSNGLVVNDAGEISYEGKHSLGSRIFEIIPTVVKDSVKRMPDVIGLDLMCFAMYDSNIPHRIMSGRFLKYYRKHVGSKTSFKS
jgi:hypothetical protein